MYFGLALGRDGWGMAKVAHYSCPSGHEYCVYTWALPIRSLDDLPLELEEIVVLPEKWTSRSGVHFAQARDDHPVRARHAHNVPAAIPRVAPGDGWPIFAWIADKPFAHERWLMTKESPRLDLDGERVCVRHYAEQIALKPDVQQGHLAFRRVYELPARIYSAHQPGVRAADHVYHHSFKTPGITALARDYSWGVLGSIDSPHDNIVVESLDHDRVVLEVGVWEFFHPRPDRYTD